MKKHCEGARRMVSPAAVQKLRSWPWRGNARELENVIERSLALTEAQEIGVDDLPVGLLGGLGKRRLDRGLPAVRGRSAA